MARKFCLDLTALKEDLTSTMYHEHIKALMPEDCHQIHICYGSMAWCLFGDTPFYFISFAKR